MMWEKFLQLLPSFIREAFKASHFNPFESLCRLMDELDAKISILSAHQSELQSMKAQVERLQKEVKELNDWKNNGIII